jgi:hypothetical protein
MDEALAFKYYGVDWLAMVFTFVAIFLLGNKSRRGFVLMMTGNACWIVIGALSGSIAMVIANLVFLVMNARAWTKWSPEPAAEQSMIETKPSLIVLYQWAVRDEDKAELTEVWKVLTDALRVEAGSLGSRLHYAADGTLHGYAQWPSEDVWRKRTLTSDGGRKAGVRFGQLATDMKEPVLLRLEVDLFAT